MNENDSTNQDNGLNKDNKKSNKGIIAALIVIIAVLVIGGVCFAVFVLPNIMNQPGEQSAGLKEDPNVFFDDESIEEYMKTQVDKIRVNMNYIMNLRVTPEGKRMIIAGINNKNDFQCKVDLMLENEIIAETGLVPPGAQIPEVELKKDLGPGKYELSVVFTAVSEEDNQTSRGKAGLASTLIINEGQ